MNTFLSSKNQFGLSNTGNAQSYDAVTKQRVGLPTRRSALTNITNRDSGSQHEANQDPASKAIRGYYPTDMSIGGMRPPINEPSTAASIYAPIQTTEDEALKDENMTEDEDFLDVDNLSNMSADMSVDMLLERKTASSSTDLATATTTTVTSSHSSNNLLDAVDAADESNELCVTEYIMDIMTYIKRLEQERMPTEYMPQQTDINPMMREILVDWLVEVHLKFKLRQESLYLAINYLDRFLSKKVVNRSRLQMLGCTAMLLACKIEEIYSPQVQDFIYISANSFTKEEFLQMEQLVIATLKFELTIPTIRRFAERWIKVAGLEADLEHMVYYLCEMTLQKYKMTSYRPSVIAASAVYLTNRFYNRPAWTATLERHTEYSEADLKKCSIDIHNTIFSSKAQQKAVRRKFSGSKFNSVSMKKLVPLEF